VLAALLALLLPVLAVSGPMPARASSCDASSGTYGGGTGDPGTPYLICSPDHLAHLAHLLSIRRFPILLDHFEHALSEHALHLLGLRRVQVGDGGGVQVPWGCTAVKQDVSEPRLRSTALDFGDHHVNLRAALRANLLHLVCLVLAVALAQRTQHLVLDGLLGKPGNIPATTQIPGEAQHHGLVLPILECTLRKLLLLLLGKLGVIHNSQEGQSGHQYS
jgi:hypothetical protein